MFWGVVTWQGSGPLIMIEDTLKGDKYAQILSENIPQVTRHLHTNSPYLIEDSPHVHKTKASDQETRLHLRDLSLPPNSPDLNPIERVWGLWKDRIRNRNPRTMVQLINFANEEWMNLTPQDIQNYIRNIPNVIQEIIRKRGGHSKY